MKDTSSSISMQFMLGNLIYEDSVLTNCVEVSEFELKSSKTSPLLSIGSYSPTFQSRPRKVFPESNTNEGRSKRENNLISNDRVQQQGGDFVEQNRDLGVRVTESSCISLWGFTSVYGKRVEMEDTVVALPNFLRIPMHMLTDGQDLNNVNHDLLHVSGNFFGVYDGHGGSQVANYCRDRIHLALAEEIESAKENPNNSSIGNSCREIWNKTLLGSFSRVDAEVAGVVTGMTIAPEAVGSTAVVAVVCPKHIIVANCGDSRAVLCRGKVAMPLSEDHKPNREDERKRIEDAGGKVICFGPQLFLEANHDL